MNFNNTYIDAFGYELAPNVVTSEDLEDRLAPLYKALHLQTGQLEALTGVAERRFWDPGMTMSRGAALAGEKALRNASVTAGNIGMMIYAGVCRDNLEPATACAAAHTLGISPTAQIMDVSNACLGVLNGMVHVANAIENGQIEAGMVVSCESARQIVNTTIERMLTSSDIESFKMCLATLTGGSGAVAVVLTRGNRSGNAHKLLGGAVRNATEHHELCRWGPDTEIPESGCLVMETDSVGVLNNGVALGIETYADFRRNLAWPDDAPDKLICHQVGSAHQRTILKSIGIPEEKDFTTFEYLGNVGTVSLPITAAIADEREFLQPGDRVGFMGIGSGLNCLMLGVEW